MMPKDPNDLFEAHGIVPNAVDQNDLLQQQMPTGQDIGAMDLFQQQQQPQPLPQDQGVPQSGFQGPGALRGFADIATGMARGGQALRNAPYNIVHAFSPETAEKLASGPVGSRLFAPDIRELGQAYGITNPNTLDKLIQGAAMYGSLAAATGGRTLGAMAIGGAITGGLLEEKPLAGALTGAAGGAALGVAGPMISGAIKGIPSAFRGAKAGFRPVKTLKELYRGYNKEAIAPVVEEGVQKYATSIGKFKKSSFLESPEFAEAKEVALEYGGPQLKKYSTRLAKNPTIENADALKREINNEVATLTGKKSAGLLDTAGNDRLNSLKNLKTALKTNLSSSLSAENPQAAQEFLAAEANWAQNVHPVKTLSSMLKNMSHKTDLYTPKGANRAAENILKEYIRNPKNIPQEAAQAAQTIAQQVRNAKLLKYGGVGAAALGVGETTRRLMHMLGGR